MLGIAVNAFGYRFSPLSELAPSRVRQDFAPHFCDSSRFLSYL